MYVYVSDFPVLLMKVRFVLFSRRNWLNEIRYNAPPLVCSALLSVNITCFSKLTLPAVTFVKSNFCKYSLCLICHYNSAISLYMYTYDIKTYIYTIIYIIEFLDMYIHTHSNSRSSIISKSDIAELCIVVCKINSSTWTRISLKYTTKS